MVTSNQSLVNKYLHTLTEDGEIKYQGQIVEVNGDAVSVQLFEPLLGEPTIIKKFSKSFINSDQCNLFSSREQWIEVFDKEILAYIKEREKRSNI